MDFSAFYDCEMNTVLLGLETFIKSSLNLGTCDSFFHNLLIFYRTNEEFADMTLTVYLQPLIQFILNNL